MTFKHLCLPLSLAATLALTACAGAPSARPDKAPACPPPETAPPAASQSAPAPMAQPTENVRHNAPFRYVVQPGDTLWDISARFFKSPWLWPELWYDNPYIKNPHLIYPGDVITFAYVNGHPALSISRGGTTVASTAPGVRMLRPKVERTPLAQAIPTIPYDDISALLSKPRVMTLDQYHDAAYILMPTDGQLVAAVPDSVYARDLGEHAGPGKSYAIVHKAKALKDPDSGKTLGYEVLYLGRAEVTQGGDPATLKLVSTTREVHAGDRLVAAESGIVPTQFPLRTPCTGLEAAIIDVIGGISEVAQYQVVVLDRGKQNGLRVGDVLGIYRPGKTIRDPYARNGLSSQVELPERREGELVVFRAFKHVSYGLIMRALRPIKTGDVASAP
jgi:hypothetical protein